MRNLKPKITIQSHTQICPKEKQLYLRGNHSLREDPRIDPEPKLDSSKWAERKPAMARIFPELRKRVERVESKAPGTMERELELRRQLGDVEAICRIMENPVLGDRGPAPNY